MRNKNKGNLSRWPGFGIYYVAAVTLGVGVIDHLAYLFFKFTHNCYPVWEYWLAGWQQKTSHLQVSFTLFFALFLFTLIIFVKDWKASNKRKGKSILLIYLFVLSLPIYKMGAYAIFHGAMLPTSPMRPHYEKTMQIVRSQLDFEVPFQGTAEGVYGSCAPGVEWTDYAPQRPRIIGALKPEF